MLSVCKDTNNLPITLLSCFFIPLFNNYFRYRTRKKKKRTKNNGDYLVETIKCSNFANSYE